MPAFIKTPKQEEDWKRAKDLVHKQYPKLKEKNNRFWQLTNHIYQNMQPKKEGAGICEPDKDNSVCKNKAEMTEEDMIQVVKDYIKEHPEFDPEDCEEVEDDGVCKNKK